jgi:hypothetical protein
MKAEAVERTSGYANHLIMDFEMKEEMQKAVA